LVDEQVRLLWLAPEAACLVATFAIIDLPSARSRRHRAVRKTA